MAKWASITDFNEQYGTGNAIKNKIFIKVQNADDCEFLVQNLASIDVPSLIFLAHNDYRQIIAKNQLYSLKMSDFTSLQTDVSTLQTDVNVLDGRVDNIDSYIANLETYIDSINGYIGNMSELEHSQTILVNAINDLYDLIGDESVSYQITQAIEAVQEQVDNNTSDITDLKARTISIVQATGEEILNVSWEADLDGENNPTGGVTYTLSTVKNALDSEITEKIDNALSLDSNQDAIKILKQLAYEIGYFKTDESSYWVNPDGVAYSVIDIIMDKLNGQMTQAEIEEELAQKLENININNIAGNISNNVAYVTLDSDDIKLDPETANKIATLDDDVNNMSISYAINILNDNINEAIENAGVTALVQGGGVVLTSASQTGDSYQGKVTITATGQTVKLAYNVSYISGEDTSEMSITDAISILSKKINDNSDAIEGHETRLTTAETDITDMKEDIQELQQNMSYLEWSIIEA